MKALTNYIQGQKLSIQEISELRYGKGNKSLLEWAKKQLSLSSLFGSNISLLDEDHDDYEGFFRKDSDSMAIYLAFAEVGLTIAETAAEYSKSE